MFDHTPDPKRTEALLRESLIGWLGTVRPDGRPHLVPVWFYWTGSQLLITAMPSSRKIVNLRSNSSVSFGLDNTRDGHEPILLEGHAEIEAVSDRDLDLESYFQKYNSSMRVMEWSEAEARATHSALIRVHVDRFVRF